MNEDNRNTNGSSNPGDALPDSLRSVVSEPTSSGQLLKIETGLFELGRKRALRSGATQPVAEDQKSLEEHSRAIARETYRDRFDPAQHPHDKVRQDEFDRQLAERTEAQKGAAHARANLRDAENNLAKTPKAGEKPIANPWVLAAAIVAISLSVAPSLHDRIFDTLNDDLLVWLGSSIGAGFVAALLTSAIIAGRKSVMRWIGLAAGVGVGIALALVRLSTAETISEFLFAGGLTIFEIAAVLLLDWVASSLRESEDKWSPAKKAEDEAMRLRDADEANLARWTAHLQEINTAIRDHIAYVEDRAARNLQVSDLESVATKAVLDGYNAGITENIGRIIGVGGRP